MWGGEERKCTECRPRSNMTSGGNARHSHTHPLLEYTLHEARVEWSGDFALPRNCLVPVC